MCKAVLVLIEATFPSLYPHPPLSCAPLPLSVTHADYFHGCALTCQCFVMLLRCVRALRTCTHAMMPQCLLPGRDAKPETLNPNPKTLNPKP